MVDVVVHALLDVRTDLRADIRRNRPAVGHQIDRDGQLPHPVTRRSLETPNIEPDLRDLTRDHLSIRKTPDVRVEPLRVEPRRRHRIPLTTPGRRLKVGDTGMLGRRLRTRVRTTRGVR